MCPSSGDFRFTPDTVPVDRDVISIPIWDSFIVISRALPFFYIYGKFETIHTFQDPDHLLLLEVGEERIELLSASSLRFLLRVESGQ
jgi:hypothetical protein